MKTAAALVMLVLTAVGCQSLQPKVHNKVQAEVYEFTELPTIGKRPVRAGGFSGLIFEGRDEQTGEWFFLTTTDRGPNLEAQTTKSGAVVRPFLDPQFQIEWIRFSLNPADRGLKVRGLTPLTHANGKPIGGLPNLSADGGEEIPVEVGGKVLEIDPQGLDTEAIARDSDGSYWMGEEYRPSLLHFTSSGQLITRWIPEGGKPEMGIALLPKHHNQRRLNRGYEGIALYQDSIFGFLQSGLPGEPDVTRVLQVEKKTGKALAEFIYPFETTPAGWSKIDKIGDAVSAGDGTFYVIEQNSSTGEDAFRRIYRIDPRGATNLLRLSQRAVDPERFCPKERTAEQKENCLLPVKKELVADLVELGFRTAEKAEGLALVDSHTLAVVNDNDFTENPIYLMILRLPN